MDDYTRAKLLGTGLLSGDAPLDQRTGAQTILSDLERDINEGHGWELFYFKKAVGTTEQVLIQLNTGDEGLCVRRLIVWGDAALALLELFRGPTLTDGTTAVPIRNLNHASERELPSGVAAFSNPSAITEEGDCYHAALFGGGEEIALASKAWVTENDVENILAPNTKYLIRLTNLDGRDRNFSVRAFFCA